MLIRFVLISHILFFLTIQHHGELHERVKRSLCALVSQIWYQRIRKRCGFTPKQAFWDQNGSVHQELNVKRCFEIFESIAGFIMNAFAARKVITIRKKLTRARRSSIVSRATRLCQGAVCLSEKNQKTGVFGIAQMLKECDFYSSRFTDLTFTARTSYCLFSCIRIFCFLKKKLMDFVLVIASRFCIK